MNSIEIPGNATDLSGQPAGTNTNQLSIGSDLYYDRANNVYYGLADRGPGGGVISYDTRVHKFSLDVDLNTGAISGFKLLDTILFKDANGNSFNGLNPGLLNGNPATLGNSFDPEGFVVAPNGNFYVSDEYGPSVYEFTPQGVFVRAFTTPANLISKKADSTVDYVAGRPTITTGRQDNRGFEGVTLSPDGKKLYAMLQDPLVNEGAQNDGRRSQNLRIVEFDTATGQSTAQYIYQLESRDDINARIPGTANDFSATAQGRNIGISAIVALSDTEFLILERDNRGLGVDPSVATLPVGSKRVYKIDITGATDVSGISLAGSNSLPNGVVPVKKSAAPFIDIAQALLAAGETIPEKIEGLAIGPQLNDGTHAIILATDNDFSVTQNSSNEQFYVCTDGKTFEEVPLNTACPAGLSLVPSFLYSFKANIPEPATVAGLALLGLGGLLVKRQKSEG
ncbi:esterase-like activity of phytase family protein [Leptolyngbya sp. 'hensonii']|uniref:esterase-like activity of phytase family protein n=1 Tax=Leptolyngbya sp. 'hensonii' TaxID=1922337 RepID=UPI001C0D34AA|nr:esterase-like activity of phytase family protein [Leptolyngbya sp. 'hensonii']